MFAFIPINLSGCFTCGFDYGFGVYNVEPLSQLHRKGRIHKLSICCQIFKLNGNLFDSVLHTRVNDVHEVLTNMGLCILCTGITLHS